MPEDKPPFDDSVLKSLIGTSQGDQASEGMANLAKAIAVYYQALMAADMPQEMAEELALDYHWLMIGGSIFKDGGLPPRSY